MTPCLTLSNIRYVSRVKWSNPGKGVAPSPTPLCCSYWKGRLRVSLDYDRLRYICKWVSIYIYIYIYILLKCLRVQVCICIYIYIYIVRYVSSVKWRNSGKGVVPSSTPRCSSYWKGGLLVALAYSHQLYFLFILLSHAACSGRIMVNKYI